jgi:hypothetical protein
LEDDRPYLVMSYADQGTLADRLEADGLTVAQATEVIRQVGEGLAALHQRGVLHRDIKPANVLFRTVDPEHDGTLVRAMVGDLGLGKALDVSSRLTMIAGTPSFVAPEQAQGEHLDARADQYSLAALSYLLLTGRSPYAHGTLSAAANPAPPKPMSTPERPFPAAVEDVVRRGLALDRGDRYADVRSFVDALRTALGEEAAGELPARWLPVDPELTQPGNRPSLVPARDDLPAPVGPRRRRRWPAVALAMVLLVAGAVGGYAAWRQMHADVTVEDARGVLSVTVPVAWSHEVSRQGWIPADSSIVEPGLSAGDGRRWASASDGQGVFAGLLPENKLPTTLPHHQGCSHVGKAVRSTSGASLTEVSTGCPGFIIEQATQVSATKLLWVQVRGTDLSTAREVLDSVQTHGAL